MARALQYVQCTRVRCADHSYAYLNYTVVYSDCSLTTALINQLIGGSCNTFPAWKLVLLQNNRVKALHSRGIQLYHGTIITWYGLVIRVVRTFVRTRVQITLSQKQLEIQALRCNGDASGRCQHRRHHGILQLRFQLDSGTMVRTYQNTFYRG